MNIFILLGIPADSTKEQVKAAYRRKALELHPDHHNSTEYTKAWKHIKTLYEEYLKELEQPPVHILWLRNMLRSDPFITKEKMLQILRKEINTLEGRMEEKDKELSRFEKKRDKLASQANTEELLSVIEEAIFTIKAELDQLTALKKANYNGIEYLAGIDYDDPEDRQPNDSFFRSGRDTDHYQRMAEYIRQHFS